MAENNYESPEVLKVSLKTYKDAIADLRAELLNLSNTSDEYKNIAQQVSSMQNKLNEVMSVGKKTADGVDGSYNKLQQRLTQLKKEWKTMDMGSKEWKKTGKEIAEINNKLKDADAKIGDFGRNVGDYANQFSKAFGNMGASMVNLLNPIKAVKTAMKALWANPWLAIIGAVALAVQQLVKAFKRNSEATDSLRTAMIPLQKILTLVQRGFDKIVEGATKAIKKITEFLHIGANEDDEITKTQKEIIALEREIQVEKGKTAIANAKANQEIERLKAIEEDQSRSAADRRKALADINKYEEEIADNNIAAAQREYDLLVKKASLNKTSAEDQAAIDEANARLIDAQTAKLRIQTEAKKKLYSIGRREDANNAKELKADSEYVKAQIALIDTYLAVVEEGSQKELDLTTEKLELQRDLKLREIENSIKDEELRNKTILATNEKYDNDILKAKEANTQKLIALDNLRAENTKSKAQLSFGANSLEYFKAEIEAAEKYQSSLKQLQGESNESFEQRQLEAQERLLNAKQDYYNRSKQLDEINVQNEVARTELEFGSNSMQAYESRLEAAKAYYDSLEQLQGESNEEFEARELAAQKAVADAEKALYQKRIDNFNQYSSAIGSLMSVVSNIWQESIKAEVESGKISEEEGKRRFENSKIFQYAETLLNTSSAVVSALAEPELPWVVKAVNAATALATGTANAIKIKNTQFSSSSSPSSAIAAATPVIADYTPRAFTNLTSADEVDNINSAMSSKPIWVSVSDINAMQKKVSVREEESAF